MVKQFNKQFKTKNSTKNQAKAKIFKHNKISKKRNYKSKKRSSPEFSEAALKISLGSARKPQDVFAKEVSDCDSEPDAFTQLISCFKDSSKQSIMSDDDSESDEASNPGEISDPFQTSSSGLNCDFENNIDDEFIEGDSDIDERYNECSEDVADPFENHIHYDMNDDLLAAVSSVPQNTEEIVKVWPALGNIKYILPKPENKTLLPENKLNSSIRIDDDRKYAKPGQIPPKIEKVGSNTWRNIHVKSQIQNNILFANSKMIENSVNIDNQLTPLQEELFSVINNYQDLYYPERSLENGHEVMLVYCLHVINHVLKTRLKVEHHNSRLAKHDSREVPDEFRDQGLVRPKVLILVPFRSSAVKVVELLSLILFGEGKDNLINKKRFYDEFTSGELIMPRKKPKPQDYEQLFTGDTDDNFKIGISLTKKSLKLYVDFYSADIIVASPLGLRVLIGAPGQRDRDYDFLSSIEILIVDQTDVILMQNWDHLLHLWDHFHLQPTQSHGTNFARVRLWALSGRARFYRQTLMFSSVSLPHISSLFSRKCHNYAGKAVVINPVETGTICQIVIQLPHVFNRIDCTSAEETIDARFNHFVKKILPQFKEPIMNHTLIYVPSYFDFVRIRNHFNKENISFKQICEYTKEGKVARARDMFFHSDAHFLLYSERFHFFRRIRIKGIRHIVFYQPPTFPHFYSELCNLMQGTNQTEESSLSVSVLYTRYDAPQLAAIVGSERAARMLASDRPTHMFMTAE